MPRGSAANSTGLWPLPRRRGAAGQLREVDGCPPVDLENRVGVVPECCCATSAVAESCGGVPQVEAASEELAGGVMPAAFDVKLHADRGRGVSDLVSGPAGFHG